MPPNHLQFNLIHVITSLLFCSLPSLGLCAYPYTSYKQTLSYSLPLNLIFHLSSQPIQNHQRILRHTHSSLFPSSGKLWNFLPESLHITKPPQNNLNPHTQPLTLTLHFLLSHTTLKQYTSCTWCSQATATNLHHSTLTSRSTWWRRLSSSLSLS